ncbi:MAG: DUF4845 domain-containing protein [Rhodocyclaceae bacterium]|nr:DUF4845 domain-containing protein [Rhodocyclaceae bacterium]MBK6906845.1 DUF4845 domain-containing protein [Rhodocyclaceae bacterium]
MTGLLMGGAILFIVALVAMKVAPAWMEFGAIKKAVVATAQDTSLKDATVTDVRTAFGKRAEINDIKSISGTDLEVTKDGNGLVIEFAYTSRVPLAGNASLVFEFSGSSQGKRKAE